MPATPVTVVAALVRRVHDGGDLLGLSSTHMPRHMCRGRCGPEAVHTKQPYEQPEHEKPGEPQQWLRLTGLLIA
ncbi:hypothetical protein QFZ67_006981 [Streptomyces sp. V1I1]|nr:hypothetical protein [Streptomyces sp. V1I1]